MARFPRTMSAGTFAGQTFQTTQQYNNALAQSRGYSTYAAMRAELQTPNARSLFAQFAKNNERNPTTAERRQLVSQFRRASQERSYAKSQGFERRKGSEFDKFLDMLGREKEPDKPNYSSAWPDVTGEQLEDIASALDEEFEVE